MTTITTETKKKYGIEGLCFCVTLILHFDELELCENQLKDYGL